MEIISIIGIIILIVVALSLGRILSFALKLAFYVLLSVLFFVFIFGISYADVISLIQRIILWTF